MAEKQCQNCGKQFKSKKTWHKICKFCWQHSHSRGKSKKEIREINKKQTEQLKKQ